MNVVLILTDDMRFDFMSIANHPYLETPNIDRLAHEGTLFNRAYVVTPLCGPNRASINTGLLSSQHGIINHSIHQQPDSFYPEGNFLPRTIHDSGTTTAMIGKWFHSPHGQPRPEYDRWFVHNGTDGPFGQNAYTGRIFNIDGTQTLAEEAAAIAGSPTSYATDIEFYESARWTNANITSSLFAFVSPYAPHSPFTPAKRHNGTYDGMEMPIPPNFYGVSPQQAISLTKSYNNQCEMMLALDEGIGHLYDQLSADGILENTVIIFTSDNGLHFGEHGRRVVKKTPFEETCRIPLIVRYGSNLKGQGPVDSNQLVSQADLMLTIVELMGGKIPKAAKGTSYYGRSLASEWMGTNGTADVQRRDDAVMLYYHSDTEDNDDDLDNEGLVWASIVTDDGWKYTDVNLDIGDDVTKQDYADIVNGIEPMLYNLNDDPYELDNLAGLCEFREIRIQLQQRLTEQLEFYDAEFVFANVVEPVILGDVNGDGAVNLLDVSGFIELLNNEGFQLEADINEDCQVNLLDVGPFIQLLSGS